MNTPNKKVSVNVKYVIISILFVIKFCCSDGFFKSYS